ncbi:hypothetical protein [Novosphingobium sp. TH158]|nr:hypothetical protein [Novosphingobium sp. TH158]
MVLAIVTIVVLLLLVWAWIDGGQRELHPVEQDVAVPESVK